MRYDRHGRKIAENSLNPNGSADRKIIYVYDKDGHVEEEIIASIKKAESLIFINTTMTHRGE
ncbi:hypothetical protein SFC43_10655 [Bacteroides sp. CR5/BHMF/2]|nr:hypothetical protein [Bacteroides sp. CR5/BHMF/2]